jgi:hypothetical protein
LLIAIPFLLRPTQSLKKYKTHYSIPGLQQVRLEHPVHPVADRHDPVVRSQQGRVLRRPPEASGQGGHQPGKEAGPGVDLIKRFWSKFTQDFGKMYHFIIVNNVLP